MKTITSSLINDSKLVNNGIETLSMSEMLNIRGGNAPTKIRTKEIDVYDTREY